MSECCSRFRVVSGSTRISTFSLIVFLVIYRLGVLLPLPVSLLRRGCRQPALAPQSAAKPQTTTNGVVAVVCSGLGCRDVVKLPGLRFSCPRCGARVSRAWFTYLVVVVGLPTLPRVSVVATPCPS